MEKNTIICPSCNEEIDVQDVLSHKLEAKFKKDYKLKNEELESKEADLNKEIDRRLQLSLAESKQELSKQALADVEDILSKKDKELDEQSEKIKKLNSTEAALEKMKRKLNESDSNTELEIQKRLSEELNKVKNREESKYELKEKELQKKLDDYKTQMKTMQQKIEQGSVQLQGEVQELAIEEWLETNFKYDAISEIKKGARGADCLQVVNNDSFVKCGTIYYESKRAKDFKKEWIEKFKDDMRIKGADIGVLVTSVYPKGMDRLEMVNGVWICSYDEFKSLSKILRISLIDLNSAVVIQEGKESKMSTLYDYLTSSEFKMEIEGIVDGFTQMRLDLEKEKNAFGRIWKQREKQLQKVTQNTISMYGSIKGIAGKEIESIDNLELPYTEE